jgi:hypothetical protein
MLFSISTSPTIKRRGEVMDAVDAVANMLEVAKDNGLEPEVVWLFGIKRGEGYDTEEAAAAALNEFDI